MNERATGTTRPTTTAAKRRLRKKRAAEVRSERAAVTPHPGSMPSFQLDMSAADNKKNKKRVRAAPAPTSAPTAVTDRVSIERAKQKTNNPSETNTSAKNPKDDTSLPGEKKNKKLAPLATESKKSAEHPKDEIRLTGENTNKKLVHAASAPTAIADRVSVARATHKTNNMSETNTSSKNPKDDTSLTGKKKYKKLAPAPPTTVADCVSISQGKQKTNNPNEGITSVKNSKDDIQITGEKKIVDRMASQNENIKSPSTNMMKRGGVDVAVSMDEVDRAASAVQPLKPPGDKARELVKAEREAKKLAKLSKRKVATKAVVDEAFSRFQRVTGDVDEAKLERAATNPVGESMKSKAELRAERRAKQDAQRAAKLATIAPSPVPTTTHVKPAMEAEKAAPVRSSERVKSKPTMGNSHRVDWFRHLHAERSTCVHTAINCRELHPAVVRLGVQLSSRAVAGANARCIALLHALKQVVSDYVLPARTEFARGLEMQLTSALDYVLSRRPASASMTNAVKHLRWQLTQLPNNIGEFHAKHRINEAIDTYICDQILMAGEAISIAVRAKISHGDLILTYGASSLVERILIEALQSGLQFRVVVVGSGARAHGVDMLRRLSASGVRAHLAHISAVSFLMRTTDKVLLGAASLLGNGWVVGRAGTAQVALVARAYNVPVLIACETHKFSERVQTDAFVYNELGDPEQLVEQEPAACALRAWRTLPALTPLHLTYDVTPPDLVTAVVTELAVLPCTSAPVVLRFKLSEYGL